MPKICYQPKKFSEDKLGFIAVLDGICQSYARQGYGLTLRGLYYQCVTQNIIANKPEEYNRLSTLVADARLAGLINWDHIIDATRGVEGNRHWDHPSTLLSEATKDYQIDKWVDQDHYVEVWIEKDALKGVLAKTCIDLDVPLLSCRGYTSLSEMWAASQRLLSRMQDDKEVHIIHLGDHDPSGLDMSRDIKSRLGMFTSAHGGTGVHVLRIALNMSQVQRLNLPPNPAKVTDSRAANYIREYGDESWELDAIPPVELNDLVNRAVKHFRDEAKWDAKVEEEAKGRKTLTAIYDQFDDVVRYLRGELA